MSNTTLPSSTDTPTSAAPGIEDLAALFGWADYLVFGLMLAASAGIGIFYGFKNRNEKDDTQDFLMAGKQMTTFPVAMSLIARWVGDLT